MAASDNRSGGPLHPSQARPSLRLVEPAGADGAPDLEAEQLVDAYVEYLERSPLSEHTRRAYGRQVRRFIGWLFGRAGHADALSDPMARDFAVRDYRSALKEDLLQPSSVNAALAAIDHLYRYLGMGPPQVRREAMPAQAPKALSDAELRNVLREAERRGSERDRAIVALMAFAGLRLSEVAGLDVPDVALSARKGAVTVRRGKGDVARTIPLSSEARLLVDAWMQTRPRERFELFPSRTSGHLSTRAIDRVVRSIGEGAGVPLSAHVLRHTFVTRLIRSGADVVIVAELAGHRSLETTRLYALPTAQDRADAVERLAVDP